MEFIKKRFQIIRNDSFLSLTLKITLCLIGLHLYQWIDSNMYEPLVRMIISCIYIPAVFFFGRYGCYTIYFLYANYISLTCTFQNYTGFIIITILVMLLPKLKMLLLCNYIIDIFIVSTMHNKTPVHLLIHFLNCIILFYTLNYLLKPYVPKKKLELTIDEIYIIEELLGGKQQKEIERFSPNTVTNKLKSARERNKVATTEELLQKFIEQN